MEQKEVKCLARGHTGKSEARSGWQLHSKPRLSASYILTPQSFEDAIRKCSGNGSTH